MAVVVKGMLAIANSLRQIAVVYDGGRRPSAFNRQRIQQWLHGRAGLPWSEDGVVANGVCISVAASSFVPGHDPGEDLIALMVNDEHRSIMYAAPCEILQSAVEDVLRSGLNMRVQCRMNLSPYRGLRQAEHPADKMTRLDRGRRGIQHPRIVSDLLALLQRQLAALSHPVGQLLHGPMGPFGVVAQIHSDWRPDEH